MERRIFEERYVIITHEKSSRNIYTRFTFSDATFNEFVRIIDYLHDKKCVVERIDEDDFEDYPDMFSDEKLEICLDEGFGKLVNRI